MTNDMGTYHATLETLAAVRDEIVGILGEYADDYDIDAIAADCFTYRPAARQFFQTATEDEFWASVAKHDTSAS